MLQAWTVVHAKRKFALSRSRRTTVRRHSEKSIFLAFRRHQRRSDFLLGVFHDHLFPTPLG